MFSKSGESFEIAHKICYSKLVEASGVVPPNPLHV